MPLKTYEDRLQELERAVARFWLAFLIVGFMGGIMATLIWELFRR